MLIVASKIMLDLACDRKPWHRRKEAYYDAPKQLYQKNMVEALPYRPHMSIKHHV
jgi:hypothetical protein